MYLPVRPRQIECNIDTRQKTASFYFENCQKSPPIYSVMLKWTNVWLLNVSVAKLIGRYSYCVAHRTNCSPVADPDLELRVGGGGGLFTHPAGVSCFSHFFFFHPK